MLLMMLAACAPCPGIDPMPLFFSPLWNGPEGEGIAWLGTFEGPGSICDLTCEAPWASAAIVLEDGPCIDEGPLDLEEGERAGLCVVIDPETPPGHTYCELVIPSGPVEIALVIHPAIRKAPPTQ